MTGVPSAKFQNKFKNFLIEVPLFDVLICVLWSLWTQLFKPENHQKPSTLLAYMNSFNIETIIIIIIWDAYYPYSQLRAELQRTRLQRVREAGMQGRLWLPGTSTHYDHGAQPEIESVWFFPREENWMVWKTLVAQQRTNATNPTYANIQ